MDFTRYEFRYTKLIRALQIALAGRHNLLVCRNENDENTVSEIIKKGYSFLPPLKDYEKKENEEIYSQDGCKYNGEVPFVSPHPSATIEGMCGGGVNCHPGAISMANNGILYVNELHEFKSSVIQMLRVPLHSKAITLSRGGATKTLKADFQLISATLPCPCGHYGLNFSPCFCSKNSLEAYWNKVGKNLLDKFGIKVKVDKIVVNEAKKPVSSLQFRNSIKKSNKIQTELNCIFGKLTLSEVDKIIHENNIMDSNLIEFCTTLLEKYNFTASELCYFKTVAMTIASLEGRKKVTADDFAESMCFVKGFEPCQLQ